MLTVWVSPKLRCQSYSAIAQLKNYLSSSRSVSLLMASKQSCWLAHFLLWICASTPEFYSRNKGKSRTLLLNLLLTLKSLQDVSLRTFFGPFSRMKQQLSLPISSQAKKIFKMNCFDRKQEVWVFFSFALPALLLLESSFWSWRHFQLRINYRFDKLCTCCSQRSGVVNLKNPFIS